MMILTDQRIGARGCPRWIHSTNGPLYWLAREACFSICHGSTPLPDTTFMLLLPSA